MKQVDFTRPGVWQELFPKALALMAHLESVTRDPPWSFGGGTVLMLRIGHRLSKDIDLFVPDPQYLGYVNPRLSDVAESITHDYEEAAEYIKLLLPQGEIDIVVGTPLTASPFEWARFGDREIRVETSAEIVAKKMWHRGDRAKVRDLLDLWAVSEHEPDALPIALPFLARKGQQFLDAFANPTQVQRQDFDAIDVIGERPTMEACIARAREIIGAALDAAEAASSSAGAKPSLP